MKPLMEVVVSMKKEANSIMTMSSGSTTSKNLMEGIIKMKL